ncbi:MAG: DUF1064 domain-containing protein [Candidatus Methanoperedens sp.]|nr:DUF1064 domain-containing protein [Candidatus Methanoperedens sp.]
MTFIRGKSKYNNHKVEIDGYKFDSKKEGSRYLILRQMQKEGEIANLKVPIAICSCVGCMDYCAPCPM